MKTILFILTIALLSLNIGFASETQKPSTTNVESSKVEVIHLSNETFKQLVFDYENKKEWKYQGTTPCIIDFYASWCGPCKKIAPILEELATEYKGKVIIYKVNTEKERQLSGAFGIKSIPAILFVPVKGQPQMVNGALPKASFVQAIEDVLLVK